MTMAKDSSSAVRLRAGLAMGKSMGVPTGTGTKRFKKGGSVDKTTFTKYGNGFRKGGKASNC
jgi:hypothetical protein